MATLGASSDTIPTDGTWYEAELVRVESAAYMVKTFTFRLPHQVKHLPGQHYELRLTAAGGYQAARLYSAASAANGTDLLQLTIANMPDGEVTPYLHEQLRLGDHIEIRGPLGRSFVWDPVNPRPVLLLAGGVGVVPLRCMLQAHKRAQTGTMMRLLYSTRAERDILYGDELLDDPRVMVALTREWPDDWQGITGRIMRTAVRSVLDMLDERPMCYVCGMTGFVEAANMLLLDLGVPPMCIRAERFGE